MAKKLASDRVLFTAVLLLLVFGLVMVYSATGGPRGANRQGVALFTKQALAALIGLSAMGVAMHIDYRWLAKPAILWGMVGAVVALLVLVLFQPAINGSRRWFLLGPISLQPSELAKVAVVPFLAYLIHRRDGDVNRRDFLVPVLFVLGLIAALIMVEPDLGTAVLVLATAALMIFLAGLEWRKIFLAAAVALPSLAVLALASGYRMDRVRAFLEPEADPMGSGYQATQSLIAIGSGGIFGLGPGGSLQKLYFLPQPESDFIFAIIAEELGLIGALGVLAAFAVVLWRGARAGLRAPDLFGRHLAWGITTLIVLQACLNIGVAVRVLPTTGIPLPLLSYGGSSLVITLVLTGLLLNVSEHG